MVQAWASLFSSSLTEAAAIVARHPTVGQMSHPMALYTQSDDIRTEGAVQKASSR
jgi:hypothetical protein